MIDLFFSGILISVVLLWALGVRGFYLGRLASAFKKHVLAASVPLWVAFFVFAALFVLNFEYFDEIHDIDEAVQAAVKNFIGGVNPYEQDVVPRFQGKYAPNVVWTLGPYNYLPLDLLVYVVLHGILGWIGAPVWFVLANLILSGVAFVILRSMLKADWIAYIPIAGIVMLFYSFDNASLTLLLMVLSMYVYSHVRWHPGALAILIMALATMTKVFAGIPLIVLIFFELQTALKDRRWRKAGETVAATGMSAAMAVLLLIPFGIQAVLDSAVFFHASEELREGTSVGGTLLSEFLLDSEYYTMISAAVMFAALVVGMRLRSLNDRVLLAVTAFMLVVVKSSLAPLTVAGLFLILRLKELSDERAPDQSGSELASTSPNAIPSSGNDEAEANASMD